MTSSLVDAVKPASLDSLHEFQQKWLGFFPRVFFLFAVGQKSGKVAAASVHTCDIQPDSMNQQHAFGVRPSSI